VKRFSDRNNETSAVSKASAGLNEIGASVIVCGIGVHLQNINISQYTLQNVLKRRIDMSRIIKEREKKMISGEDYRLMEVDLDNKQFLQPLDAANTKVSIYYIRQKFIRCACKTWI
jgi:hypothetical protein